VHQNRKRCPIGTLCAKLGVSRAGYYAWCKREKSQRTLDNEALLVSIREVHAGSDETYGYPRVHATLRQQGVICGRHRVARIMRENSLIGKKAIKFKRHSHRHHLQQGTPNMLLNHGPVTKRNQVWVGDVTFIKVGKEWSYLSVVMDRYTRKIIGWALAQRTGAELVAESLLMAYNEERPEPDLIFHSDQGTEYASNLYHRLLNERGILISKSRKGHCWDNAHMESFFHSLKTEMVYFNHFRTLEEATAYIMAYIRFYNHERIHSGINYMTPTEFDRMVA